MIVSVFTLGCKTNLYESGQVIGALQKAGHVAFHGLKKADVFMLNTCAITKEAERKSRQLVARARKLNPNCKVVVMGCASQKNQQQFQDIANVSFIDGVANKVKVVQLLEQIVASDAAPTAELSPLPSVYQEEGFATQERTRAFVKVQDGCNNFCSYCIVPYLRGRSRSRSVEQVVEEVRSANSAETVLIGIDISQYGLDNGQSLTQLFEALQGIPTRIRLGSLEARIVTEDVLVALSKLDFCPHFHLSLQSGCDSVLKRMNRKYTTQEYYDGVQLIKKYFPTAAITTDIIVGFCGETDEEFETTCNFVKKVGFADIHVFPFSKREGTVAYNWQDVDSAVKTHRAEVLGQIKQQLKEQFVNTYLGTTQQVMVELNRKGLWEGYTREYLRVYFSGQATVGQVVKVALTEQYQDGAKGNIVE